MIKDTSPEYWQEFTNLQHVKHELIHEYLNGWFPKLGLSSERILYIDTHAGRGEHATGQSGSPVIALETLLNHHARDQMLARCRFEFLFVEHDSSNVASLEEKIGGLGPLPSGMDVTVSAGDCFEKVDSLLASFAANSRRFPPSFAFIDPYGFKVPGEVLRRLVDSGQVELFVNIMWRELDMAISLAQKELDGGMAKTLSLVFGGKGWAGIDLAKDIDQRADQAVDLLRSTYGAQWATSVRMLGKNGQTRYVLAHFTNHPQGRDLMKDCIWKICPSGEFLARRSDNPYQTLLITPEPDLLPVEQWLMGQLEKCPATWIELEERFRSELWRSVHLSAVIRALRKKGTIQASEFTGRFAKKANPTLSLA